MVSFFATIQVFTDLISVKIVSLYPLQKEILAERMDEILDVLEDTNEDWVLSAFFNLINTLANEDVEVST